MLIVWFLGRHITFVSIQGFGRINWLHVFIVWVGFFSRGEGFSWGEIRSDQSMTDDQFFSASINAPRQETSLEGIACCEGEMFLQSGEKPRTMKGVLACKGPICYSGTHLGIFPQLMYSIKRCHCIRVGVGEMKHLKGEKGFCEQIETRGKQS